MDEGLYSQVIRAAKRHGMKTYVESHENGRQLLADGISIKSKADIPMGAMWAEKSADLSMYECDLGESASTAHIYGKKYVAGESFTADGRHEMCYTFYPGNLKPIADYMMSLWPQPLHYPRECASAWTTPTVPDWPWPSTVSGSTGTRHGPSRLKHGLAIWVVPATCSNRATTWPT